MSGHIDSNLTAEGSNVQFRLKINYLRKEENIRVYSILNKQATHKQKDINTIKTAYKDYPLVRSAKYTYI